MKASWLISKNLISSNSMSRKTPTQLRRGLAGILISGTEQVYVVPAFMLMTQKPCSEEKSLFFFLSTDSFADSQSPLITLPHFYLPVMAARGETWSVQDTMPAEISGDLPSGFGTSSHTGHSLGPQRGQERGWWWLHPE